MGLFKQNKNNVKSIFTNDITANQNYIFVKNGFLTKQVKISDIVSYGICYGLKWFNENSIKQGKITPGGLEKFFSGEYNVETIPAISIFIKTKDNKNIVYPLTIGKTKKGRTLITAENIFDNLEGIIKDTAAAPDMEEVQEIEIEKE